MSAITLPFAFSPNTRIKSSDVNSDLNAIVTEYNAHAVQTDTAKTITASHTFTGAQTFSGGITSKLSNSASGTTASLANGAGATIISPAFLGTGSYFLVTKATATHAYHSTSVVTYDTTTNLVTVTVLASNGITVAASTAVVNLTNATGSTNTFSYAYLRLL
jgi:hypothetical protein